jgi:hypothetical protein
MGGARYGRLGRVVDWCSRLRPVTVVALAGPLVALIGALDFVTGKEISFSIFYLAPVALATWLGGRGAGIAISATSTATWFLADRLAPGPSTRTPGSRCGTGACGAGSSSASPPRYR